MVTETAVCYVNLIRTPYKRKKEVTCSKKVTDKTWLISEVLTNQMLEKILKTDII